MKKILTIFLVITILFGCSSPKKTNNEKVSLEINEKYVDYKVDMSEYQNMRAFDHQFVGMSPKHFLEALNDENFNGIIFIGFKECHFCQEAASTINQASLEFGSKVYYIDAYSKTYPLDRYYEAIMKALHPLLKGRGLSTPLVLSIKNGQPKKFHIGLSNKNKWESKNPSKEAVEELKNIYFNIFNEIK